MTEHTFNILEFSRIVESIAGFCSSLETQAEFKMILPETQQELYEKNKRLSRCWARTLERNPRAVIRGWEPIGDKLGLLKVDGATLEKESLFFIGNFCKSVQGLSHIAKDFIPQDASEEEISIGKELSSEVLLLPNLGEVVSLIFAILDDSGEVKDLPEIRAIRKSISSIKKEIDSLVRHYTTDESLKTALQSAIPSQKDGRTVIALKANFRGRVKGIVHEVSQSGQTVYLEPQDVVEKNNDLVKEEARLLQEIQRILRELTQKVRVFSCDIEQALKQMLFLDRIFAVARWGASNSCVYAFSSSNLCLKKARHPLLGRRAVPIDLVIPEKTKVLLITGPNTGGKTVSLKTVGLFVLLNQCGFPIPCQEGSSLPHFKSVFADLGDEQSLDQSLSTFSGHMKNISAMFQNLDSSLILLDELGSGTDPEEGSALAMALLDAFLETDSLVLATTHHSVLKNYGYTHESCQNASMDFDKNSLSPTYRMIMGVPGESCALDIALSNGIDKSIVEKARSYVREERADVSALIKGLTSKHEELHSLEQEKKREERELREKHRTVDLKNLQLRQKEIALKSQGYKKLDDFVKESRKELENLVRTLREGEITREKTLQVKNFISNLQDSLDTEKNLLDSEIAELNADLKENLLSAENLKTGEKSVSSSEMLLKRAKASSDEFFVGQEVWVENSPSILERGNSENAGFKSHGQKPGVILHRAKKGSWLVSVGILKLTVQESMLSPRNAQQNVNKSFSAGSANSKKVTVDYSLETVSDSLDGFPKFELDIRGFRLEEALQAMQKQLEAAILKNLTNFSIVHGKGEGVLSKSVHECLKECSAVSDYYFASPEAGGFGKTIVVMKS